MKLLRWMTIGLAGVFALGAYAEGPLQRAADRRKADANKDGDITGDEVEKWWAAGKSDRKAAFKELDANNDGVLVKSEVNNDTVFKKTDSNGDGRITENEFLFAVANHTRKTLDKTDSNNDGVISDGERAQRVKERIEKRRSGK